MSFTPFGYLAVIWTVVPSFQMGWHISALNVIHAVLTCKEGEGAGLIATCIPMTDAAFGLLTSSYTIGGLIGSLSASYLLNRYGRKGSLCISTGHFAIGGSLMSTSDKYLGFVIGRTVCGLGAGIGLCVVPIMLAEIAPVRIRGSVGVLNQVAIVLGILSTQAVGMNFNEPGLWRIVLTSATVIALVHMLLGWVMVESPLFLQSRGKSDQASRAAARIWKEGLAEDNARDPLLNDDTAAPDLEAAASSTTSKAESVIDVITNMAYRKPLITVVLVMISQQISGINAVMYYSTEILGAIMPTSAAWISLMIAMVNALMTFPAIALIERLGRRTLLIGSAVGLVVSLLLLGIGIDFELQWLASVAILGFVASFAVGLGPVPYVMISDVAPNRTVGAMSTIGLSLNWITNFVVALTFLPLRNLLSNGGQDVTRHGRVFYLFAVTFSLTFISLLRVAK